jgi:hypothetical protein
MCIPPSLLGEGVEGDEARKQGIIKKTGKIKRGVLVNSITSIYNETISYKTEIRQLLDPYESVRNCQTLSASFYKYKL